MTYIIAEDETPDLVRSIGVGGVDLTHVSLVVSSMYQQYHHQTEGTVIV